MNIISKWDVEIDKLLHDPDKSKVQVLALILPFVGYYIWWRSYVILKREQETIKNAVNRDVELAKTLSELSAEAEDNGRITIYQYVSDDMLSWEDKAVVAYTKQFLWENVYDRLMMGGANGMFADKIEIEAYKIPPTATAELHLKQLQSDEVRKVVISIYPTYLGTPKYISWLCFWVTFGWLSVLGIIGMISWYLI